MNEEQARVFIQDEVRKELSRQFWKAVAIVGIANLVALAGMWFSVNKVADDTARSVATSAAEEQVNKNEGLVRHIEKQLGDSGSRVVRSSEALALLEEDLSDAKERVTGLKELTAELDTSDQARLAKLLIELKNSPTTQALAEQIAAMKRAVSGHVSPAGRILSGTGFKVERQSMGFYTIAFDREFDALPAVVVSVTAGNQYRQGGGPHAADTTINVSVSGRKATVWLYQIDTDGKAMPVDEGFSFVAL